MTSYVREYPVADDRGGIKADYKNQVTFMANIRKRLDQMGIDMGLSITLVSYRLSTSFISGNVSYTKATFSLPRTGISSILTL